MVRATLLILALIIFTSCGSRKRALDKTKEQTETAIKTETQTFINNDVKKQAEITTKVIQQAQEQEQEFTGEVADPTKPASVMTEQKDGKTIQTFTNFKNVSNSSKTANKSNVSDAKSNIAITDNSTKSTKQKEQSKSKESKESKTVQVERKTGFPWWLWLIVALIAGGYVYYSYLKNTYNPLSWFK